MSLLEKQEKVVDALVVRLIKDVRVLHPRDVRDLTTAYGIASDKLERAKAEARWPDPECRKMP